MTDTFPSRPARTDRGLSLSVPLMQLAGRGTRLAQQLGLGALSDRRLRKVLDLAVLDCDPADAHDAAIADAVTSGDRRAALDQILCWDRSRAATVQGRRKARVAALALAATGTAHPRPPGHPVDAALRVLGLLRRSAPSNQIWALLDRFDAAEWSSPLLAETHYRAVLATPGAARDLRSAHDDWADLDPGDPAVWHGYAAHLLDAGRATAAGIAAAAARAEWQTERFWGKGGYALFLLPVMSRDPALWDRIDPERLAAAALDLARHRHKDQGAVNRIARDLHLLSHSAPGPWRPMLRTSYRQVLEESLNTLLPGAWGLTETAARRRLAEAFLPELRAGARLRATPAGLALSDPTAC